MLHPHASQVRIGDQARFPLGRLGEEDVYRHRWEVTAFRPDGCVHLRRLHDGIERVISASWLDRYAIEDRPRLYDGEQTRGADLARIRARLRQSVQWQDDATHPGYYVSAIKGKQYTLLLGPFTSHYDALLMVREGRHAVHAGNYSDPFGEIAYGTCKVETSERRGKLNQAVFGLEAA